MAKQVESKYEVKNIIDFPREVRGKDIDQFKQLFRLQFFFRGNQLYDTQITFDRVHKTQPKLSKPVGYLHIPTASEFFNLAIMGMAGAAILELGQNGNEITEERLANAIDGTSQFILGDAKILAQMVFEEIKRRAKNGDSNPES